MIYTHLTKLAMTVAYQAHHGQIDHGNMPYIFHPYHLAEQMQDEYTTCAALLHDVVEDTNVTLEELSKIFPTEVIEAVALLTHDDNTDYFDYVTAIKENPIARAVKIADLKHNSDRTRLEISESNLDMVQRYEKKYRKALDILK